MWSVHQFRDRQFSYYKVRAGRCEPGRNSPLVVVPRGCGYLYPTSQSEPPDCALI